MFDRKTLKSENTVEQFHLYQVDILFKAIVPVNVQILQHFLLDRATDR